MSDCNMVTQYSSHSDQSVQHVRLQDDHTAQFPFRSKHTRLPTATWSHNTVPIQTKAHKMSECNMTTIQFPFRSKHTRCPTATWSHNTVPIQTKAHNMSECNMVTQHSSHSDQSTQHVRVQHGHTTQFPFRPKHTRCPSAT